MRSFVSVGIIRYSNKAPVGISAARPFSTPSSFKSLQCAKGCIRALPLRRVKYPYSSAANVPFAVASGSHAWLSQKEPRHDWSVQTQNFVQALPNGINVFLAQKYSFVDFPEFMQGFIRVIPLWAKVKILKKAPQISVGIQALA